MNVKCEACPDLSAKGPDPYFRPLFSPSHMKNAVSGMAYFSIAKDTLSVIGFETHIWIIGIRE